VTVCLASVKEDALSVKEAQLFTMRRFGAPEQNILTTLGNLSITYQSLGKKEQALSMRREVYFGFVKLEGAEHGETLREVSNYMAILVDLQHFDEAKSLMRKTMPVVRRRVLGHYDSTTLRMRMVYAIALCRDSDATLDDLREAVTTLEETERIARRVLGRPHPLTTNCASTLRNSRAQLTAVETPPVFARGWLGGSG
jgi:hypothetical protein